MQGVVSKTVAILALTLGVASVGLRCSNGPGSSPKSNITARAGADALSLEQTEFAKAIELAAGEEIIALGRLDESTITLVAKTGKAWNVNVDDESVEAVAPFVKKTGSNLVLTASKDYVWVLEGEGTIGRNKNPPDGNMKFEISKVSLGDGIDAEGLVPLSVTGDQVLFLGDGQLIACTWDSTQINVKQIGLPTQDFADASLILGAGPIGKGSDGFGFWLATSSRLFRIRTSGGFGPSWQNEKLTLKTDEESPQLLSMWLADKAGNMQGATVGLFGSNVIATLEKPKAKKK